MWMSANYVENSISCSAKEDFIAKSQSSSIIKSGYLMQQFNFITLPYSWNEHFEKLILRQHPKIYLCCCCYCYCSCCCCCYCSCCCCCYCSCCCCCYCSCCCCCFCSCCCCCYCSCRRCCCFSSYWWNIVIVVVQAYLDLLEKLGWETFTILYESNQGLIRLQVRRSNLKKI